MDSVVAGRTAFSRKIAKELRAKMTERKKKITLFVCLQLRLPRFCKKPTPNRSVRFCGRRAPYKRMQQTTCTCVSGSSSRYRKRVVTDFNERQPALRSNPTKMKASAKTGFPKSVPATNEAFHFSHGLVQIIARRDDRRLHVKVQWIAGCGIGVALRVVTRAWSTSSKSIGLGSVRNVYLLYLLYGGRMTMLQVLESREDGLSPLPRLVLSSGVGRLVSDKEEADKTACEHSEPADQAVRLLE